MKKRRVIPIRSELRELLDDFLKFEAYQPLFKEFAKIIGYHGNNMIKVKKVLFAPNDEGEIGFTIDGMEELLLEYQLLRQLTDKEPYKTLLSNYPKAIQNIRTVAHKVLNKEDIGEEDLLLIFNTEQYESDKSSK